MLIKYSKVYVVFNKIKYIQEDKNRKKTVLKQP
jgi:hypothetical protein